MISIREALSIRDGHIIHDHCGRTLEVKNYSIKYENGLPISVEFSCRDIYTNERLIYSYDEIYIDYNDLCDEQKLFLTWFRKDPDCHFMGSNEIRGLKLAFMTGFSEGLLYKRKNLAQEQLQK